MSDISANNKRIAKNTMLLYIRTFITMVVGLYTSRVMLNALGVDNYGINNVVGGIVSFSALITGTMAASSSRYLTYSLGEGVLEKMKNVFATVANVQIVMGILAVIILEIVGVWFLNTAADIPEGRMYAANCVLQCSIVSTFVVLVSVPFNSLIIAHEHMDIYAYMSILEVAIKLGVCFLIRNYGGDRLILFSILWTSASILTNIIYAIFCFRKFEEVKYQWRIDGKLFKEMAGYSGWNLLSNTTWMLNTQGVNMLINIFFGVAFNATRGIATTVNGAIQGFVSNFTTAFSPQITKSYAAGNYDYCYSIVNKGAKYTWYLMFIFLVPVCIETDTLLHLWLVEVPPMVVLFVQLSMFESLALQSSNTLLKLIQATGNIKRYAIDVTIFTSLVFPLTWVCYKFGFPVWISYPIFIIIYFSTIVLRFKALSVLTTYQWRAFITEVLIPCLKVSILSWVIPLIVVHFWSPSLLRFFVLVPGSVFSVILSIYILGLNDRERVWVKKYIMKFINRFHNA